MSSVIEKDIKKGILPTEINEFDMYGKTPLHYAIIFRNFDMSKNLITLGANLDLTDKKGRTPVHYANYEILKFIIENYPEKFKKIINKIDLNCETILDIATKQNNLEICELINNFQKNN